MNPYRDCDGYAHSKDHIRPFLPNQEQQGKSDKEILQYSISRAAVMRTRKKKGNNGHYNPENIHDKFLCSKDVHQVFASAQNNSVFVILSIDALLQQMRILSHLTFTLLSRQVQFGYTYTSPIEQEQYGLFSDSRTTFHYYIPLTSSYTND